MMRKVVFDHNRKVASAIPPESIPTHPYRMNSMERLLHEMLPLERAAKDAVFDPGAHYKMPPASKNKKNKFSMATGKGGPNYAPPDNMELDRMLPPIGAVKKLKESTVSNPTTQGSKAKMEALQTLEKKAKSDLPPFLLMKI